MANATVHEAPDRYAVVATVDGRTQLWGTASADADPERLVRAFRPGEFHAHSTGKHLRVMAWKDWKAFRAAGEPAVVPEPVEVLDEENERRAALVAGLRELADLLAADAAIPIPRYPHVTFSTGDASDTDDRAAIDRVRAMAAALGIEVVHRGRQWMAYRMVGAIEYGCSYVERAEMDEYRAALSYQGGVEPAGSAA